MFVKAPKKRTEFERILKRLGYKDQSPIFFSDLAIRKDQQRKLIKILKTLKNKYHPEILNNGKKIEHQILEDISGSSYTILYFTIPYFNKKSYLYSFFIENYTSLSKKEMMKQLKVLCKEILYKEKTRICEVGWSINNYKSLYFSTKEHLIKIYFEIIKKGKKELIIGDQILKPKVGDVLVSKPDGGKLIGTSTNERYLKGREQRGLINKKFGFGNIKSQNSQYARYDENLILKPI